MDFRKVTLFSQIVKANTLHLIHQIEALNLLHPQNDFTYTDLPHSLTIRTNDIAHGSKLNRTVEFGMRGPVTREDLLAVERLYARGLQPTFFLYGHCDPSATTLLTTAGYNLLGSVSTLYIPLIPIPSSPTLPPGLTITTTRDAALFSTLSNSGFSSNGRASDLLRLLSDCAAARPDTTLYLAYLDSEPVGSAAFAVLDVTSSSGETAPIANLYIDSTLPAARGNGVQAALIAARLRDAAEKGCVAAIASVWDGQGSARNYLRAGMEVAFSGPTYTKG